MRGTKVGYLAGVSSGYNLKRVSLATFVGNDHLTLYSSRQGVKKSRLVGCFNGVLGCLGALQTRVAYPGPPNWSRRGGLLRA